jgi:hypothetical protein
MARGSSPLRRRAAERGSRPTGGSGRSRQGRIGRYSVGYERRARSRPRRPRRNRHPAPEGAEVVVLTDGGEEPFDIDEADTVELEARTAEADGGQVEPAGILLARLRGR